MAQSLAKIYVHAIFSTKHRLPCLTPEIRPELYRYASGVLKNIDCPAIQIGGTEDHMHILGLLSKNINPEEMIEKIKTPTSKWIKTKGEKWAEFHWQNGYGLFSVSQSNVQKVMAYILKQEEHHEKKTFQEEFRLFLKRYQIPYDERYVWD